MKITELISDIRNLLNSSFNVLDSWFDAPESLRVYKPRSAGWTIDQVLEHVYLTNHFLLILIEKGTRKALHKLGEVDLNQLLADYDFQKDRLDEVGRHQSFQWMRPEHMDPKGIKPREEIRSELKEQLNRCLNYLEELKNGEGILFETTMSVNNFGKLDVYEYIYFLAQHIQRHIQQIQKIEAEFQEVLSKNF